MYQQNDCGCSQTTVENTNCGGCPPEPCTCPVKISTDCSTYNGDNLSCSGIEKNTILTDVIKQLDAFICTTKDQLYRAFSLVNIGTGSQIYKGVDGLGRKELRTIKSISSDLVVTQTPTEIQLYVDMPTVDGSETKVNAGTNVTIIGNGTIATPYTINAASPNGSETKVTAGTNTTVSGAGTIVSPYVINSTSPDGSETKVNAGTNVTVSGVGSVLSPYIINSTGGAGAPDATSSVKGILKLTNDLGGTADLPTTPTALHKTGNEVFAGYKSATNFPSLSGVLLMNAFGASTQALSVTNQSTVAGADFQSNFSGAGLLVGTNNSAGGTALLIEASSPSTGKGLLFTKSGIDKTWIDNNGDFTAPKLVKSGGTSTQYLMADGSTSTINGNVQFLLTTSGITLDDSHNNGVFIIDNGGVSITITVSNTITKPGFCVGFIQKGTGDVNFITSGGATITNPIGYKIKGQGYQTFIEREFSSSNYFLLGNTKL